MQVDLRLGGLQHPDLCHPLPACPLSSVRGLGLSPDSHTRLAADGNSWSRWKKPTSGHREAGWRHRAHVKGGNLAGARDFQEMTLVRLCSALWSQPDQSARAKGRAGAGTRGLCQQLWACARHMQQVPVYVTLSQHLLLWGQEAVDSRWIRASLGPTISIRKSDRTQNEMLGGGVVGLASKQK